MTFSIRETGTLTVIYILLFIIIIIIIILRIDQVEKKLFREGIT